MKTIVHFLSAMLLVATSCKKSNLPAENVKPETEIARIGKVERGIPLQATYTSDDYKLAEVFIKQEDIAPLLYDRTNTLKYVYDASGRLSTLTDEFKSKRRNGTGPNPPLTVIDFTKGVSLRVHRKYHKDKIY